MFKVVVVFGLAQSYLIYTAYKYIYIYIYIYICISKTIENKKVSS